jgi:VWFA-related protein
MRQAGLRRLCVSLALAALLPPAALAAQTTQRALYVSVTDNSGSPVPGLGPADFVVREDRVTREVLKVEPATEPMHIALLIDNSQASEPFLRDLREGATTFISAIGSDTASSGKHQVAIIALASRPTIVSDYTSDRAQLMKNALRLFSLADTGTYLLDGIIETSEGIVKRAPSRPVMVAITTEGPELSNRRFQAVLEPLREAGAPLHIITVGRPENLDEDRSVVIAQGTRSTGGRNETILVSTALPSLLKQLANDLTHQYRVTYARPQTLIPPEMVTVSVSKAGLSARGTLIKEPPRSQERK